jgi:hypothetical protein
MRWILFGIELACNIAVMYWGSWELLTVSVIAQIVAWILGAEAVSKFGAIDKDIDYR